MTEVERAAQRLIEAFREDSRYARVERDLTLVRSSGALSSSLSQIVQEQAICRRNERVPAVRGPALARLRILRERVVEDPFWVNFSSSYRALEDLARSLKDTLESI